jgi:hypothetical protein
MEERRESMVARLVGDFPPGSPRACRIMRRVLDGSGLVPAERTRVEKAAVVRAALDGKPTFLLRVPLALSPDRASDVIIEHVQRVLDAVGVA